MTNKRCKSSIFFFWRKKILKNTIFLCFCLLLIFEIYKAMYFKFQFFSCICLFEWCKSLFSFQTKPIVFRKTSPISKKKYLFPHPVQDIIIFTANSSFPKVYKLSESWLIKCLQVLLEKTAKAFILNLDQLSHQLLNKTSYDCPNFLSSCLFRNLSPCAGFVQNFFFFFADVSFNANSLTCQRTYNYCHR